MNLPATWSALACPFGPRFSEICSMLGDRFRFIRSPRESLSLSLDTSRPG